MTNCFQIIDGNTEQSISVIKGAAADAAIEKLAKVRGAAGITAMMVEGQMEIVEYKDELYFNLYI